MSRTQRARSRAIARRRRARPSPWWSVAAGAAVVAAVLLAFTVTTTDNGSQRSSPVAVPTGETNAMGAPVIETPGTLSGTASAGPVEVTGADWALGTVPLNVAVRAGWVLHNSGSDSVTVGEPHAEVVAGCCPGPFTIDHRTIPPGGDARLTFELTMHPGMDGWHDMAVHVPVTTPAGKEMLTLNVTGDFRPG